MEHNVGFRINPLTFENRTRLTADCGAADFETERIVCGACGTAVALPEAIEIDYIT